MKSAQQVLMCSLILLPVVNAEAKDTNANGLDFGISAAYNSTDNAKRSSLDELAITETQTIYEATLGAHYQNEWGKLISSYAASKEIFQRESQPDATEIEGRTQLTLGNDYQPLSLTVNHSRIAMLNSPEALDLAQNRDTQEVIAISPAIKTHFSAADSFVVMGSYTDISYKKEQQKKSEQQGLQLAWIHGVNKTDTLQLTAQYADVSFEFAPQADYQLQNINAQYSVSLKRFNYTLQAGYDSAKSTLSDEDFASPTYSIQASYVSGSNTFALSLEQSITDSSMGMSNSSSSNLLASTGTPAKGVGIDLLKVRKANVSWTTTAICERCDFGLNAIYMQQDYRELNEDGDEYGGSANLKYNFTRAVSIDVSYGYNEHKFSAEGSRTGFESINAKVGLNYAITRDLQLGLYANQEKRTSALDVQNYQENIIGLNLSYHFK